MTEWTPEHERALRELASFGLSAEEIADALDVTAGEVAQRLAPPAPQAEARAKSAPRVAKGGSAPGSIWTEERVAELMRLREAGESWHAIARTMGISVNAVVGKAHRLGLEASPERRAMTAAMTRARLAKEEARILRFPVATSAAELPPHGCRWIEGEVPRYPAMPEYCDAPTHAAGEPYCTTHRARAWIKVPRTPKPMAEAERLVHLRGRLVA